MVLNADLEGLIRQLTAINSQDSRFSGEQFMVNPASVELQLPYLQRDLIVIKVGGKLLLDEKEPDEELTKREQVVQTMALLSKLGLNVFLIHGGQEQLDRAIAESELSDEEKEMAMLKDGEVRYTPQIVMSLIVNTSNSLSLGLKQDIIAAGGNANAYLSSLFMGNRKPYFTDETTGTTYDDNNFGQLRLDDSLRTVHGAGEPSREARVLNYLSGALDHETDVPGHIVIRGFLVNYRDHLNSKRSRITSSGRHYDPFVLNGDADIIAAAHALYFADKPIVPVTDGADVQFLRPEMIHLTEIARNGGLRASPNDYDSIVDIVTSEADLIKRDIEGGMDSKARTNLQLARALDKIGVQSIVKTEHIKELLPDLFGNEKANRERYGKGFGTTFTPRGLKPYTK